jgi:hypothetical protein
MFTRRRMLACLAAAACLGLAAFLWLSRPNDRITFVAFEAIQPGMSLPEVEGVLGCPPGRYAEPRLCLLGPPDPHVKEWWGARALLFVHFGNDGRVVRKYLLDVHGKPYRPDLLDRLRVRRW